MYTLLIKTNKQDRKAIIRKLIQQFKDLFQYNKNK